MRKLLVLCLIFCFPTTTIAQSADICGWGGDLTFVVPPITKEHPRMWYTKERLETLRTSFKSKKGSVYPTVAVLIESANNYLEYKASPYLGPIPNEHRFEAVELGERTLVLSLAYQITSDNKYSDAAIRMLDEWISTKPMPGTTFEINGFTMASLGMATTLGLVSFLQACDLLYGCTAWSKDFEERFNAYLDVQQTNILYNIKDWSFGAYKKSHGPKGWIPSGDPDDRAFGGQLWQNHHASNTMGLGAIAYYKGDRQLAQYALDCSDNIHNLKNLIDNAILVPGDTGINRGSMGIKYSEDSVSILPGEMYDRYRHKHNDAGQGLKYSIFHLMFLLDVAELAYQNGLNVYNYESTEGKSLELALTFFGKLFLAGPEEAKKGYYNHPREIREISNIMNMKSLNSIFLLSHLRYPDNQVISKMAVGISRKPPENFDEFEVGSWILAYDKKNE